MYYFTCISFAIRASGRKSAMNIFIHHEWYEKEKKKKKTIGTSNKQTVIWPNYLNYLNYSVSYQTDWLTS